MQLDHKVKKTCHTWRASFEDLSETIGTTNLSNIWPLFTDTKVKQQQNDGGTIDFDATREN